jgi:ABC-type polysaccharide/polyol phosphate export permease
VNKPDKKSANSGTVEVLIHEPFKAGLPNLPRYFRDIWARREFALELSKANLRSQEASTFFGRMWLVINPLFLGSVYFVLVSIISKGAHSGTDYMAHLLAGLFAYQFFSQSMINGSKSVLGVGKMVINRSFPRLILPISSVLIALYRFLPSLVVYFAFHLITKQPVSLNQLYAIPAFLMIFIFAIGVATLLATLQIYFRDLRSFLPYLSRIFLYATPVLYYADTVPENLEFLKYVNPLFGMFGAWGDSLVRGEVPATSLWVSGLIWSLGTFFLGTFVFLSREREFAVRI